ncbi:hypothetical protein Pyrde_0193 [Pyrodictium delaneyi]|uniref:N-acetyltransferase domain-containing protein n=1 Tax=Pyrodictium delaneyi TaxID=1273541 RepID=A0A0P0N1T7_9CREN|nr:GNAT family N-acetyltransferase [Pyrodictium delaneyi]ALL00243.1 hypothetical protein Pyrde_0193 [Pyrodictium delaneyi]OWJ54325.1 hypothetical protein Pdsh_07525 [Pyrodictium delaneyi]
MNGQERLVCSFVPGNATLKDGSTVGISSPGEDARDLLLGLFQKLSLDTVLLRFLRPIKYWEPVVNDILSNARIIIIGLRDGEAVASAEAYDTGIRGIAELGIVVRDDLQGKGLGTTLTALLALCLLEKGYHALEAYFDPGNIAMRRIMVDKLGGRVIGYGRDMVFTRLDLEPNRERLLAVLRERYKSVNREL